MKKASVVVQAILILAAIAFVIVPPGAITVERFYSKWLYPILQANLTSLSNRSPIALFDVAIVVFILIAIGIWTWSIRLRAQEAGDSIAVARVGRDADAARGRLSLVPRVVGTELRAAAARVDDEVRRVADHAGSGARAGGVFDRSRERNARGGTRRRFSGDPRCRRRRSIDALHQVEKELGRPRPTVIATPKWSMFSPFYRASGVSGQLGPFFLETLLNPDLTGPERPAVLAHEWAHLSGYAPESDASFVGLLAALRAGPAAEYSAWLDLVSESVNQLQPVTQRLVLREARAGAA